ncbi:DUF6777 domain-containing protein [Streptomyces sp. NPDC007157]|uniref:DUF6777 domain-containing protein n=1 Tax=Streptomyces sp. NPDC007157 TaxID=3154681 RepID=UPI0033ED2DC6
MSIGPPSSGRPTGPPSGPLSGPAGPPPGPPSQPPGGGGGGSQGGQPNQPWWRSTRRIGMLTTAVVVAAVLAVVFTRPGGGSGKGGEVFLQAADSSGQDPFTESSATKSSVAPASSIPAASSAASAVSEGSAVPANEVRGVDGGAPGLYSGTKNSGSCDIEKQISYFQASPSRNRAFAAQVGVRPSGVPAYLRSLTPVQLRADTRVTAHGYRDGGSTTYQSVLQTGTAVLVDGHGVPQVRCACGNPLTPPVAQKNSPRTTGSAWSGYRPSNVVVVAPAAQIVNVFVLFDHKRDDWFGRHRGDHTGHEDRPAKPPADPNPMNPPVHHGCPPTSGGTGRPGATPCPSASTGPSGWASPGTSPGTGSKSPSSNSPSSKSPSSESPSSKPPSSESPKTESPKSESPKSESPKTEPPKSESPKTESPKSEAPKSESPKTESPKPQAPVPGSPAPESPKSEVPPSAQPPSVASPGSESAVSSAAPVSPQAPPSSAAPAPPESGGLGSPPV